MLKGIALMATGGLLVIGLNVLRGRPRETPEETWVREAAESVSDYATRSAEHWTGESDCREARAHCLAKGALSCDLRYTRCVRDLLSPEER